METPRVHRATTWMVPEYLKSNALLPERRLSEGGERSSSKTQRPLLIKSSTSLTGAHRSLAASEAQKSDIGNPTEPSLSKVKESHSDRQSQSDLTAASDSSCSIISHLTPDRLSEILRERGFGDPRVRNKPDSGATPQLLSTLARKRKRMARIPFVKEKLKGQAHMEFDIASIRAHAFCDKQRQRTLEGERLLAEDRYRLLRTDEAASVLDIGAVGEDVGKDDDVTDGGAVADADCHLDEDLAGRIESWIVACEEALQLDNNMLPLVS